MNDPSPETAGRLREAAGYLELGMLGDSAQTLESVASHERDHPDVLLGWCETLAAQARWPAVCDRARELTRSAPQVSAGWFWLGYALRRADSATAAWQALRPVAGAFRDNPVVDYNFACYACLDGHLDDAKSSLARVFQRDPGWRDIALRDEDLKALQGWIRSPQAPPANQ
jgi:Flp pilus assembly protein TadD